MSETKSNKGTYVVVRIDGAEDAPVLEEIGSVEAASAPDALRAAVEPGGLTGTFKVVPARNWKTYSVTPTTHLRVEVVE